MTNAVIHYSLTGPAGDNWSLSSSRSYSGSSSWYSGLEPNANSIRNSNIVFDYTGAVPCKLKKLISHANSKGITPDHNINYSSKQGDIEKSVSSVVINAQDAINYNNVPSEVVEILGDYVPPEALPFTFEGDDIFVMEQGCPPEAFNLTSPSDSAPNQDVNGVILQWSQSVYANGYYIYVDTFSPPTTLRATNVGIANTSWDTNSLPALDPLQSDTTYYWNVEAYNGDGTQWSNNGRWSFSTGTPPEPVLEKGPYLIYEGNNTKMTVLWQLDGDANCTLRWGPNTLYETGNTVTTEYGDNQHKRTITNLTPGSKYYYQVEVPDDANYAGSFRTAPATNARDIKFMVMGDTQSSPSGSSLADVNSVCAAMFDNFNDGTGDPNYQTFTLHTGDRVYYDTNGNWDNDYFNRSYDGTLNLHANLPTQGCRGNHDDDIGGLGANYDRYWPYPYSDRSNWDSNNTGSYWSFDYGPAHILVIDQFNAYSTNDNYVIDDDQMTWIDDDLAATSKEWKFILLHAPGYDARGVGPNPIVTQVRDDIQALCETHGVDILFNGHQHYYAHSEVNDVKHITTVAGAIPPREPDGPDWPTGHVKDSNGIYHFCKIEISDCQLNFEAVDVSGNVVDSFSIIHEVTEANNPSPADNDSGVPIDTILSWQSGNYDYEEISHDIYFGPNETAVTNATVSSAEYMGNVDVNNFDTRRIHAFTWTDSNMTTLASLGQLASPDFNSWAEAFGLSGTGNIIGVSYDENFNPHAVIWEVNSVSGYDLSDLHTIATADESVAYGISDFNWVVGRVDVNAFLLKDIASPNMIKLASLFSETDSNSVARSISNGTGGLEPVAVGWSGGHAAYWDNLDTNEPNVHDLGTVESYCYSRAYRTNEYRQVVGYYWPMFDDPNHHTAFVGDLDNGLSSIGNLESGNISRAYGINNAGQVVGEATTDSNDTTFNAFIYDNCQMYNLNSLLRIDPCDSNDYVITSARSITDEGYITGYGKIGDINDANNYDRSLLLIPARPVAHWQFDETTGTTVSDSSSKGNHGELKNGPVWTSGHIRGALEFDGIDDYVDTTDFNPGQNFTVSMWINPSNTNDGQAFIAKNGLSVDNIFIVGFWGNGYHGRIRTAAHQGGTKTTGWQHIAAVVEKLNASTSQFTLYKNGTSLWSEPLTDVVGDMSDKAWTIGQEWDWGNPSNHFKGLIDDVRIYPYVLDTNEITEIYQRLN